LTRPVFLAAARSCLLPEFDFFPEEPAMHLSCLSSFSMRFEVKASRLMILVCSVFFGAAVAFAQAAAPDTSLTANPVYKKNCAKCHGKTAEGRHFGGPSLVSGKVEASSVDDLRTIINDGKSRMPKFAGKLTPKEIDGLVQEIKAMKK
jgi:mono/diheme cytochrome c family protein